MTYDEFVQTYKGRAIDYDNYAGVQCVDLIKLYLDKVFGVKAGAWGDAKYYWIDFEKHSGLTNNFVRVSNTGSYLPAKGDIVVWSRGQYGHVAVATGESTRSNFYSWDMNWGTKPMIRVKHTYKEVYGSLRPKDQSKVGGSGVISGPGVIEGPLYTIENTKEDAVVREVSYLSGLKPSISKTNIRLSVVNYTSALAALLDGNIFTPSGDLSVDTGGLDSVPRIIVEYMIGKGLPASAGVGIAANVQAECSFNIALYRMDSNGYYSGGMCQWNDKRWGGPSNLERMIAYVGSNWKNNLTGQLNFLWHDMTDSSSDGGQSGYFKSRMNSIYHTNTTLVDGLKQCANNEAGARRAADIFVRVYENPGSVDSQSDERQDFASTLWSKVVPQLKSI